MLARAVENVGALPHCASADDGYFGEAQITAATAEGLELYVPPNRQKHTTAATATREVQTPLAQSMRAKLESETGRAIYKMRKAIVEPVFGQIKECRGFRRFSLRGLAHVSAEWRLIALTHNLLKLFRFQTA